MLLADQKFASDAVSSLVSLSGGADKARKKSAHLFNRGLE